MANTSAPACADRLTACADRLVRVHIAAGGYAPHSRLRLGGVRGCSWCCASSVPASMVESMLPSADFAKEGGGDGGVGSHAAFTWSEGDREINPAGLSALQKPALIAAIDGEMVTLVLTGDDGASDD